ncbi:MAG: hypothetical protein LIO72_01440 [Ruminococcus sp.]|nr:hypothetical protein [Ruminococcus sp.]
MTTPVIGNHIDIYDGDGQSVCVFNRNTSKTYSIGLKEASVLRKLDGKNTIEDIQKECSWYTQNEISELISAFEKIGLFGLQKKKFNLLKIRLPLFSPNKVFSKDSKLTTALFYFYCVVCPVLFVVGILTNLFSDNSALGTQDLLAELQRITPLDIVLLVVTVCGCLLLHELGHAVSARHFGVPVPEIGVMLYYFMPCAYANISGINLLEKKLPKLLSLSAGTFFNLGAIGACYLMLSFTSSLHLQALLLIVILLNAATIFANGMIFIKFDAYYILEVLLDEPNLKKKAKKHFISYIGILFNNRSMLKQFHESLRSNDDAFLTHIMYCAFSVISLIYVPALLLNTILPIVLSIIF